MPKVAGPDPDPVDKILPPPMTTDELIPSGIVRQTQSFIDTVASILQRSARSKEGWKAARSNRPEPLALSEEEALNPAARGFPWKRREPHKPLRMDSLWDPVQVSSWPDNPPNPKATQAIDTAAFVELAEKYGLTDERVTSWVKHGFPGVEMPNATVLAPPHVGALKEAAAYEERNQRDVDAGFCTEPRRFPERWPVVTTPCNIVVQNGKPRLTIDPTMWISISSVAYRLYTPSKVSCHACRCIKFSHVKRATQRPTSVMAGAAPRFQGVETHGHVPHVSKSRAAWAALSRAPGTSPEAARP